LRGRKLGRNRECSNQKSLWGFIEEVFDDDSYHLSCEFKAASKRYKKRTKSLERKACKIAMKK
jgi:hypothetical protein